MFTIAKRFDFSASHILLGLPEGHPCGRMHGHNYSVEIRLRSKNVNVYGFVFDYRGLDGFKCWIDTVLDHRHLNDVPGAPAQPSAEYLAEWIFSVIKDAPSWEPWARFLVSVAVKETDKTVAEFSPL